MSHTWLPSPVGKNLQPVASRQERSPRHRWDARPRHITCSRQPGPCQDRTGTRPGLRHQIPAGQPERGAGQGGGQGRCAASALACAVGAAVPAVTEPRTGEQARPSRIPPPGRFGADYRIQRTRSHPMCASNGTSGAAGRMWFWPLEPSVWFTKRMYDISFKSIYDNVYKSTNDQAYRTQT